MEKQLSRVNIIYITLLTLIANSYLLVSHYTWLLYPLIPTYLFILLFAGITIPKTKSKRLKICFHGAACILNFLFTAVFSILYHIVLAICTIPKDYQTFILSFGYCYAFLTVFLFNALFCVFFTSVQMGVKLRALGIIFAFFPIVNLIVLYYILKTIFDEVKFEVNKEQLNLKRKKLRLCDTKYPILLVHGVFFRDQKHYDYWGRLPKELKENGARIYYGNHQSAAAIADSAKELTDRVKEIVQKTGCEKVNIIAHSKGGLDCRYAIEHLEMGEFVASLTTINTPHRGCQYADYLLTKIPAKITNKVADTYNNTLKKLGDHNPDFIAAVSNLTASFCSEFDANTPTPDYVFTQSVGSIIPKNAIIKSPTGFMSHFIKKMDGTNDGIVGESSFNWGEKYTLITSRMRYGVSHCDMTDLYRKNIDGFDVREFYVNLVHDLKERGL